MYRNDTNPTAAAAIDLLEETDLGHLDLFQIEALEQIAANHRHFLEKPQRIYDAFVRQLEAAGLELDEEQSHYHHDAVQVCSVETVSIYNHDRRLTLEAYACDDDWLTTTYDRRMAYHL